MMTREGATFQCREIRMYPTLTLAEGQNLERDIEIRISPPLRFVVLQIKERSSQERGSALLDRTELDSADLQFESDAVQASLNNPLSAAVMFFVACVVSMYNDCVCSSCSVCLCPC
jgi:hypothetical protein